MAASLARQLKEQSDADRARVAAEALAVMDQATAEVAALVGAGSSLGEGATAPDFDLPGATGTKVSLSALLAKGPVVLPFYRGRRCPYCSTELRALQAKLAEITAAGAPSVAVSPQTPHASLSRAEKLDLAFPVLSDEGNTVAGEFGLVFTLPEALREVYAGDFSEPVCAGDGTIYMVALNSMPAACASRIWSRRSGSSSRTTTPRGEA